MCAGAIVNARLPWVVFGARDPRAGACGSVCSLFDMPLGHRPALTQGCGRRNAGPSSPSFFSSCGKEIEQKPPAEAGGF